MLLALDLSTKSTGYAIFNEETMMPKKSGCITQSGSDVKGRIQKMIYALDQLIAQNPDIKNIIIEEVQPSESERGVGNLHTHKVLMWLQGEFEMMVYNNHKNLPIEYIYPSEWRKQCGIDMSNSKRREELKQLDINFAKKKLLIILKYVMRT